MKGERVDAFAALQLFAYMMKGQVLERQQEVDPARRSKGRTFPSTFVGPADVDGRVSLVN